ncbi:MAG: hypothetical protein J5517_03900 [Eubacterium sp.]|nr:hypothetical protein [Eubacterium sp.]
MKTSEKKNRIILAAYFALVFLFMFIFYTRIHPLIIYDADDWKYICYTRKAYPIWKEWNPTRILPEVLMPLVAQIGSFVIYPINKDFISANMIMNALVVGIAIAVYSYFFYKLIEDKYGLSMAANLSVTTFFLLFHFWIFRSHRKSNEYMFNGLDLTCFYYYIIPNLLNASIVMYLCRNDVLKSTKKDVMRRPIKSGVFLLIIYFALASNLYASIILASFVGCTFLIDLIKGIKEKCATKELLKRNTIRIAVLVYWLIIHIFEINGGRAEELGETKMSPGMIAEQLKSLYETGGELNKYFAQYIRILLIAFVICAIIGIKKKKESYKDSLREIGFITLVGGITLIYLVLVSTKHYVGSIRRPDVLYGFIFFLFIDLMIMLLRILKEVRPVQVILPLMVVIAFFNINTTKRTFKETNSRNLYYKKCLAIDNDIIDQIVTAEEEGRTNIKVYVPKYRAKSNWPLSNKIGDLASRALYKHGVLYKKVKVENTVPKRKKNKQFGMK